MRAIMFGGSAKFISRPGEGTRLRVETRQPDGSGLELLQGCGTCRPSARAGAAAPCALQRRARMGAMLDPAHSVQPADAGAALLLIDLDLFRSVNGSLGHDCGDCLLRAVATRLQARLPAETFLARFSGDEAAVLLRGPTVDEASEQATDLLECVDEPFALGGVQLVQQASIGLALYPQHGESANELHSHADLALHRAKKLGRRNWQC